MKTACLSNSDISILLPDKAGTRDFAHEKGTKTPEGAITGVGTGGELGGTLGWLAGVGALAIPGLGPFIAAGAGNGGVWGAGGGAAGGGDIWARGGKGVPPHET